MTVRTRRGWLYVGSIALLAGAWALAWVTLTSYELAHMGWTP